MKILLIIILFGNTVFGCANTKNINENTENKKNKFYLVNNTIIFPKEVKNWLQKWKVLNPKFDIEKFTKSEKSKIDYSISSDFKKTNDFYLNKPLYSFSSDSSMFVDIYSKKYVLDKVGNDICVMYDVDSEALLVDMKKKKVYSLLYFGSHGEFDDIFWINNYEFFIVGYEVNTSSDNNEKEYIPNIWYFNLNKDETINYFGNSCKNNLTNYFETKFSEFIKK